MEKLLPCSGSYLLPHAPIVFQGADRDDCSVCLERSRNNRLEDSLLIVRAQVVNLERRVPPLLLPFKPAGALLRPIGWGPTPNDEVLAAHPGVWLRRKAGFVTPIGGRVSHINNPSGAEYMAVTPDIFPVEVRRG